MWDMDQSLKVIRALQPLAMTCGYALSLGGSVLNHGKSENDLDIVALPRCYKKLNRADLIHSLKTLTGSKIEGFKYKDHLEVVTMSNPIGKIDLIIPTKGEISI